MSFPARIDIITKWAIAYDDKHYMTKTIFKFTDYDWFTDNISKIPDDMLFDEYKDAEIVLYSIGERHKLVRKYLSIKVVRKLEEKNDDNL